MKLPLSSLLGAFASLLLLTACETSSDSAGADAGALGSGSEAGAPSDAATSQPDASARGDAGPSDASSPAAAEGRVSADAAAPGDAALADDAGSPGALPGFRLVWSDEFDGPAGQKLSADKWVYETGGSGWGNNQLEYDTDRAENASLDGSGALVITARQESTMGNSYTSARLKTQGKFEHTYGRYEARMRLPFGQGMWPAFWMLGTDIGSAGWPTCGEIDIMENVGKEPSIVHGTIHGPGYSGGAGLGAPYALPGGARFADDYHVFAVEWEETAIRWYVDGELYGTRTPSDLSGKRWVYDHPFFILLNLAVGGQWPGNPDGTTTFPQTLRVDYVRVYDKL
jgi:beta-glucanase (GH16 family)